MIPSKGQCLITGVYRSGTEYVAQLLTGHPELSTTLYHVNALRFVRETVDSPDTARLALDVIAARLVDRYDLHLDIDRALAHFLKFPSSHRCALYDAIVTTLWLGGTRTHWAEKCQLVWREVPEFIRDMPNGRAILVVRDPRSVLASFKRYTYASAPAYFGAVFNCLDAFQTATSVLSNRVAVVRYEDAARDPQATAARLYAFLGLDPKSAIIDRASWRNEMGQQWSDNTAFDEPFSVCRAIDRWRSLDPQEIAFTEAICGEQMLALGYELTGRAFCSVDFDGLCSGSPQLVHQLHCWRESGKGMQAFPTDPTMPENWQENRPALGVSEVEQSSRWNETTPAG